MVTPNLPLLLFVSIYVLFIWQFYNPKNAILKGQVFFFCDIINLKMQLKGRGDTTRKKVKVSSVVGSLK